MFVEVCQTFPSDFRCDLKKDEADQLLFLSIKMSLVYAAISPTELIRLLRPAEIATNLRKKYADLQAQADEAAAQKSDMSEALEESEIVDEETEGGIANDNGSATTLASSKLMPTPEEEAMMQERACDDPAEEAERRAAIIRSLVFGQDAQLASEFGDDEERTSVLVEFLLGSIHFAEVSKFTDEQTSVVFGIAERLFSFSRAAPLPSSSKDDEGKKSSELTMSSRQQWAPRAECYASFASMVKQHAVPDPKSNVRTFSASNVEQISEFFGTTFFRHYKAYEYSFTVERRTVTSAVNVVVGSPMEVPPLSQATEVKMTEAEKRAAAENKKNAAVDEESVKQEALAAAESALKELEETKEDKNGSGSGRNEGGEALDDRLMREINKRVERETMELEEEMRDLKEVVETLTSSALDED